MDITVSITDERKLTVVTAAGRITTAIQMLWMIERLESQQETQGVWDSFTMEILHRFEEKFGVYIHFSYEYFRGTSDVMFEVKMTLGENSDRLNTEDIESEAILGTALREFFHHFGWDHWETPRLIGYNAGDYKDLLCFQH